MHSRDIGCPRSGRARRYVRAGSPGRGPHDLRVDADDRWSAGRCESSLNGVTMAAVEASSAGGVPGGAVTIVHALSSSNSSPMAGSVAGSAALEPDNDSFRGGGARSEIPQPLLQTGSGAPVCPLNVA